MQRAKRLLTGTGLASTTVALCGAAAILPMTAHDSAHMVLLALACWGVLSLPIGLLVGHCTLSED
ncbi:MAG TPA: hypothetical protein VFW75_17555 [Acetobacteraceae bacterium]|nr:hypothetical protein [Acetobacteraceae bacterium]